MRVKSNPSEITVKFQWAFGWKDNPSEKTVKPHGHQPSRKINLYKDLLHHCQNALLLQFQERPSPHYRPVKNP